MVDLANIPDPLSPEERKKLNEERRLKNEEQNKLVTQKNIDGVLNQINNPSQTEKRLRNIEQKVDRILELLEKNQ